MVTFSHDDNYFVLIVDNQLRHEAETLNNIKV